MHAGEDENRVAFFVDFYNGIKVQNFLNKITNEYLLVNVYYTNNWYPLIFDLLR